MSGGYPLPLRPYDQKQMFLLPPSLNEWVRQDYTARVFSEIIDRLDTTAFRQTKKEGLQPIIQR
jgi:hypothetical protein